ncbi:MAG: hypothetical protein ACT4OU_05380 [Hyphomicrobium sp.]
MLRRYLIANGVTTIALYGGLFMVAPALLGAFADLRQGIDLFAMDHSWLGPVFHGVLTVTSG